MEEIPQWKPAIIMNSSYKWNQIFQLNQAGHWMLYEQTTPEDVS